MSQWGVQAAGQTRRVLQGNLLTSTNPWLEAVLPTQATYQGPSFKVPLNQKCFITWSIPGPPRARTQNAMTLHANYALVTAPRRFCLIGLAFKREADKLACGKENSRPRQSSAASSVGARGFHYPTCRVSLDLSEALLGTDGILFLAMSCVTVLGYAWGSHLKNKNKPSVIFFHLAPNKMRLST